jgi:hypothetical protein
MRVEEAGDECAPAGAGRRLIGGAQMAQPAEAAERPLPRRGMVGALGVAGIDGEGRAPAGVHDAAAEGEIAGGDVCGDGWIGGADVLRRDQEPLRRAGAEPRNRPAGQRRRTSRPAPCPSGKNREEAQTIFERWTGQR